MFIKTQKFKSLVWTEHSKIKMRQYGLSQQKILGILRKPERKEKAIVPGLIAAMRTNKKFVNKTVSMFENKQGANPPKTKVLRRAVAPGEIWVMYKDSKDQRKIISAWRFPGISKPGEEIPIPEDIRFEILNNKF